DLRAARADATASVRDDTERRAARFADVDPELEPASADHRADQAGAALARARAAFGRGLARVRRAARVDRDSLVPPRGTARLTYVNPFSTLFLRARSRSREASAGKLTRSTIKTSAAELSCHRSNTAPPLAMPS